MACPTSSAPTGVVLDEHGGTAGSSRWKI